MTWAEAAIVVGSLGSLVAAGWAFLSRSLYRDFEEKDQVAQVPAAAASAIGVLCTTLLIG